MLPASIALFEEQKPALEYSSMDEFFEQQKKKSNYKKNFTKNRFNVWLL